MTRAALGFPRRRLSAMDVRQAVTRCAAIAVLLLGLGLPAAPSAEAPHKATPSGQGTSVASLHAPFDALLRAHVRNGWVDYGALKRDESQLDGYLAALDRTDASRLPRAEQIAYWINAYNAFTIKLILRHYPGIKSIKDIPARWTTREWHAGGKIYSLDDIEHRILRKQFGEPRIHFTIVCASKSCPNLASEAYTGARLEAQLDTAARTFLANPTKGFRTRREKGWLWGFNNNVYMSKIFDWFEEDFVKHSGSVLAFVRPYISDSDRRFLDEHKGDLSVHYLPYDWSLNDASLRPAA